MVILEGRVKINNQAKGSYGLEQSCLVPKLYSIHIHSMGEGRWPADVLKMDRVRETLKVGDTSNTYFESIVQGEARSVRN